jgi:hypothetical protein
VPAIPHGSQLRADRIDMVQTHNSVILHYEAVARLFGLSVLNTEHGLDAVRLPKRQMRIFRATVPLTNAVVFVSEDARRFMWDASNFQPARAPVILIGIPTRILGNHPAHPGAHFPRIRF